jgi:hypothetical protein
MAYDLALPTARVQNQTLTGHGPVRQHYLAGIALAALVLLMLGAPQAWSGFNTPRSFDVGNIIPYSVAVGDLNGDGIPDLVVGNQQGTTVSVLLGKGDGSFGPAVAYTSGSGPISVTIGDVNGDHIPDLAITNISENTVSVLLGNGDGTFQAAVAYAVGIAPRTVAMADFNGDGIPDLAVTDEGTGPAYAAGGISVLLGNGDGTFQAAVNYAVRNQPTSIVVADFNRDGIPDLAVANYNSTTVSVLLGNGDGTFQAAR